MRGAEVQGCRQTCGGGAAGEVGEVVGVGQTCSWLCSRATSSPSSIDLCRSCSLDGSPSTWLGSGLGSGPGLGVELGGLGLRFGFGFGFGFGLG